MPTSSELDEVEADGVCNVMIGVGERGAEVKAFFRFGAKFHPRHFPALADS